MTSTMSWRYTVIFFFVLYLLVLVKLVVFKYPPGMTFAMLNDGNFIPFATILPYVLGEPTWTIALRNLGGNIILFVPFGLLLPWISHVFKSWKYILLAGFSLSLLFEVTQLVLRTGTFDVDDFILNTFGALFGYLLFRVISQIWFRLLG